VTEDLGFNFDPPSYEVGPDVAPDITLDFLKLSGLYREQAEFIFNGALFNEFLAGTGSGKTHVGTWKAVMRLLVNPGVTGAVLGRTGNDLASVLLPHLFAHLQVLQDATGVSWIRDYNKGQGKLTLINGGMCWFRPYNRIAKIRGLELGWGIADETDWSEADPDEVWAVLTTRMRAICPWPGLDFMTSPNGLFGITKRFYDAQCSYLAAEARGDPDAMKEWAQYHVTVATSFDNPYLPDHYFTALNSMSKRRRKQEVYGIVLRGLNTCYEMQARHVIDWDWKAHTDLPLVLAVDWGSGSEAHHFAAMAQVEENGRWVWFAETTLDGAPGGHWRKHLRKWIDGFPRHPVLAGVDRARPQENNWLDGCYPETYVRRMESVAEQKVMTGMEMVRDALDPCDDDNGNSVAPTFVFARCLEKEPPQGSETAGILYAHRNLRYTKDADGQPTRKVHKDNVNDHATDAARYAWVASRSWTSLHGGKTLSLVGLGADGSEDPRDLHPKATRRRY